MIAIVIRASVSVCVYSEMTKIVSKIIRIKKRLGYFNEVGIVAAPVRMATAAQWLVSIKNPNTNCVYIISNDNIRKLIIYI